MSSLVGTESGIREGQQVDVSANDKWVAGQSELTSSQWGEGEGALFPPPPNSPLYRTI